MAVAPDSARDRTRSPRHEGMVGRGLLNDTMFTAPLLSHDRDLDPLYVLARIPAHAPHREEAASAPKANGSADAGVPATVATDTAAAVAAEAQIEAGATIVIRLLRKSQQPNRLPLYVLLEAGPYLSSTGLKISNK